MRENLHKIIFVLLAFTLLDSGFGVLQRPIFQPELDQLNLEKYIMDEYLFNMHIRCIFYENNPCDPVGRWLRARMASLYLSSCISCTLNQEKEADKFMTWLHEHHPQLFRIGIAKYLDSNGITLPENSKFRAQVQKMNVPKVAISSKEEQQEETESSTEEKEEDKDEKQQSSEIKEQQRESQTHGFDEESGPSQRVLSPDSRKNKFSSAMGTNKGKFVRNKFISNSEVEDDEAEMDFKVYE